MIDWKRLFKRHGSEERVVERRSVPRRRTKLRPGKVVSADHEFLADCAIIDRSEAGLRLRAFETLECPDGMLAVFDEQDVVLRSGRVAWQKEGEIGVATEGAPVSPDNETLRRLTNRYYAVGD